MDRDFLLAGLMLAIPTIVLLILPIYNRADPPLFGLPFFYWFQGVWLFIAAGFYLVAARILVRRLGE
ncbi:MAG: DUF3311 domain-containing protein [Thermoplasmatales archaeon]|jgi:hypothetical protein|nr:DUF3311 domain-containing protein [Thermoplasmatales archaeon]